MKKIYVFSALLFACLIVLGLLVNSFDFLINSTLYNYGLQFSEEWYQQYKIVNTAFWVTFYSSIIIIIAFPLSFISRRKKQENIKMFCSFCGKLVYPLSFGESFICPNCKKILKEE